MPCYGQEGGKWTALLISTVPPNVENPPDIEIVLIGPEIDGEFFTIYQGWVNRGGSGHLRIEKVFERDGVVLDRGSSFGFAEPNADVISSSQRRPAAPGHYRFEINAYYSLDDLNYVLADTLVIEFEIGPASS